MLKLVCAIVSKILVVMIKVALIHYLEIGPNTASFFYFHFTLSSQINDKQKVTKRKMTRTASLLKRVSCNQKGQHVRGIIFLKK